MDVLALNGTMSSYLPRRALGKALVDPRSVNTFSKFSRCTGTCLLPFVVKSSAWATRIGKGLWAGVKVIWVLFKERCFIYKLLKTVVIFCCNHKMLTWTIAKMLWDNRKKPLTRIPNLFCEKYHLLKRLILMGWQPYTVLLIGLDNSGKYFFQNNMRYELEELQIDLVLPVIPEKNLTTEFSLHGLCFKLMDMGSPSAISRVMSDYNSFKVDGAIFLLNINDSERFEEAVSELRSLLLLLGTKKPVVILGDRVNEVDALRMSGPNTQLPYLYWQRELASQIKDRLPHHNYQVGVYVCSVSHGISWLLRRMQGRRGA